VYEHEIDTYEDIFYDPEPFAHDNDPVYDINTTVHEIHKTMTRPSVRLPPVAWHGLSAAGKTTWDNLTDIDKASIISNLSNNSSRPPRRFAPRSNYQSQPSPSPHLTRSAQVHEHNPDDLAQFQAAFHAFFVGNDNNDKDHHISKESNVEQENSVQENNESLHAFMTQRPPKKMSSGQPKTPGNINRLLSPPPSHTTDHK
jgi:hypothetical protein